MHSPAATSLTVESPSRRGCLVPSPFDPIRFNHLSEAEILGRIAGLLASALIRSGRLSHSAPRRAGSIPNSTGPNFDPAASIRDPVARRIAQFLKIAGPATPGELAIALGLKRRTLARRLHLLRRGGLCVVTGKTRTARYEFCVDFARN